MIVDLTSLRGILLPYGMNFIKHVAMNLQNDTVQNLPATLTGRTTGRKYLTLRKHEFSIPILILIEN
jgi:hypothetical protein